MDDSNGQNKNLIYNSQYSFVKFKDIGEFKKFPLDFMIKKLNGFHKKITKLKNFSPQSKTNENLMENNNTMKK